MEMPGAISVYLIQFRTITVTWRGGKSVMYKQPHLWMENLLRSAWFQWWPLGRRHCLCGHNLKVDLDFFQGLQLFLGLLFLHRHLSPTRKWWSQTLSRRDITFFWTIESKQILWCCLFAVAEHVLHVKMVSECLCVGVGYLNSVMVEIFNAVVNYSRIPPCISLFGINGGMIFSLISPERENQLTLTFLKAELKIWRLASKLCK